MKNIEFRWYKKLFYFFFIIIEFLFLNYFKKREYDDSEKPKKIGILLQWGIGDSVIANKLIYTLSKSFEKSSIYLIGSKHNKPIYFNEYPNVKYITLVPPWTNLNHKYNFFRKKYFIYLNKIFRIKKNNFDLLISPRFDFRDFLQILAINPKKIICFNRFSKYKSLKIRYVDYQKINSYDLIEKISNIFPLTLCSNKNIYFTKFLPIRNIIKNQLQKPIVIFHGGSSSSIKNFRFDSNFTINDLKKFTCDKILVLIVSDSYKFKYFEQLFISNQIEYILWQGDLFDLKSLLNSSDYFIGADSGPLHLSAATNCKFIAQYTNKAQYQKWFPRPFFTNGVFKIQI